MDKAGITTVTLVIETRTESFSVNTYTAPGDVYYIDGTEEGVAFPVNPGRQNLRAIKRLPRNNPPNFLLDKFEISGVNLIIA